MLYLGIGLVLWFLIVFSDDEMGTSSIFLSFFFLPLIWPVFLLFLVYAAIETALERRAAKRELERMGWSEKE